MDTNPSEAQAGFPSRLVSKDAGTIHDPSGLPIVTHTPMLTSYPKRLLISFLVVAACAFGETAPAWLLVSSNYDDSVMTLSANEKAELVKASWKVEAEGAVQTESVPESALLHRLKKASGASTERMLESDINAVQGWIKSGYLEEGLLGHVAATPGTDRLPVVQFTRDGKRLWLVQDASQKAAQAKGWKKAGVQFWLWPKSATNADAKAAKASAKTEK